MATNHAQVQRHLFGAEDATDGRGRKIRHKTRKQTTFKGGQTQPAHRWFRLTPSYSPDLVAGLIHEFGSPTSSVLDPFSGRGTTPIQCQLQGVECTGVEVNPFLHFVGRVSLNWQIPSATVRQFRDQVLSYARGIKEKFAESSSQEIASALDVGFPKIHNVNRWWREDVLCDLLAIKGSVKQVCKTSELKDLFDLVIANILLDAASITLGRLQLHFIDRSSDFIDALDLFAKASGIVCEDLTKLSELPQPRRSTILQGDSTHLSGLVKGKKFNLVITSPPYPNRYSYVWNTRPHLYFLDFFEKPKEAASLDCTTVGGTWGTATSRHLKGEFRFSDTVVATITDSIVTEIRRKDLLMSNYVAMYFDDLYRHVCEVSKCLEPGAVCAYVVGNSRVKQCIVETDLLLLEIFKACGFEEVRLEQIRKRNSGKELHETTVIVRKP